MFCRNCGKQIDDNASYCPYCGASFSAEATPVQQAQPNQFAATPVQQAQPNPYESMPVQQFQPNQFGAMPVQQVQPSQFGTHLIGMFKTFFSKDITKGIGSVASSKTLEGLLVIGAYILMFAISFSVFVSSSVKSLLGSLSSYLGMGSIGSGSFFVAFKISIIGAIIFIGLLGCANFGVSKLSKINGFSFAGFVNVFAYSYIPLIIACAANIILSLIWTPLSLLTFIVAIIMHCVLLYIGMQKLGKPESIYVIWYSVFNGVTIAISSYIVFKITSAIVTAAAQSAAQSILGSIF